MRIQCLLSLILFFPLLAGGSEMALPDTIETFVHSMYLADTRDQPCGHLNEVCIGNDLHQALLYLRLRPDDDLLLSRGACDDNLRTEMALRLQLLGLRFAIWELLSPSQQLLAGLVFRYARDTAPNYEQLVIANEARHTPRTWARLIAEKKSFKHQLSLDSWAEERLPYLFSLPDEQVTARVLLPFREHPQPIQCPDPPPWADRLLKGAPKEDIGARARARLCSYPSELLALFERTGDTLTLADVLQPLLMAQPDLAFASPLHGALFRHLHGEASGTKGGLLSWDAFLGFLATLPLVDHGYPVDSLRKFFESFLRDLQQLPSKDLRGGRYDRFCAGILFPDQPTKHQDHKQQELIDLIPSTLRESNPLWCGLTAFGVISPLLPQPDHLVGRLLGGEEPLPSHHDLSLYKLTLIKLGRTRALTDLLIREPSSPTERGRAYNDDQLRLILYHRFPSRIAEIASEPLPRLMASLSKRLTLVDPDENFLAAEGRAQAMATRLITCNLRSTEEILAALRSMRTGLPLLLPCGMTAGDHPRQPGRIGLGHGGSLPPIEAFHSLLYELIGVPVTKNLAPSRVLRGVLEQAKDLSLADESKRHNLAAALLAARAGQKSNNAFAPAPGDWNERLIQHLCKGPDAHKPPPKLSSSLSLPLAWHLLLPERLSTCNDYKRLVSLVEGTADGETIYQELLRVPLYGPLIQHFFGGARSTLPVGINFSKEGAQPLLTLLNDRYEGEVPRGAIRLALLLPPALRTTDDEAWIQGTPNLSTFLEQCKTPAICLGQWFFYGHPVARYIQLMGESKNAADLFSNFPQSLLDPFEGTREGLDFGKLLSALLHVGTGRLYAQYDWRAVEARAQKEQSIL